MKNSLLVTVFMAFIFLALTGFQCGSTEMTSAKLYIQRSDWKNAETSLTKEVEKNPMNAEAWYFLGFSRIQQGKFKDALTALDQSLQLSNEYAPKIKDAKHFGWAQTLNFGVLQYNASIKASKDSASMIRQKAIESYKLSIAYAPESTVTYHRLAIAELAEGNYDEEINYLKQALAKKKDLEFYQMIVNAYIQKADDYEAKGNKQDASDNYNNALAKLNEARTLDPNSEELLKTMIDLYIRVGRANEAKPAMREALQKDPKNKLYLYNLGVLLMQSDSLDQAIQNFESALDVDPMYEMALRNCAFAYMKTGDKMKQTAAEKESKNTGKSDKAHVEKFKQSAKLLERLSSIKSDDPNIWDALATAYGNAGMMKEAKKAIDKADALRIK